MKNTHNPQNSGTERLYITSDQLAFFDEVNAARHAKRLKDKTITAKTQDDISTELAALIERNWEMEMHGLIDEQDVD